MNQDLQIKVPHLLNQFKLNDLIRDLGLSKENSELLSFKLKQCDGAKCSYFRKLPTESPEAFYRERRYLFLL